MRLATLVLSAALICGGASAALAAGTAAAPANVPPQQQAALGNAAAPFDGETQHSGDRYTAALNFLEASGYTGITNLAADGQNFDATAWHGGHQVSVVTNPDSKLIENHG